MRSFSANFLNSSKGSSLHCVWLRVRDRLVSIWIDPAATAGKTQRQEKA